MSDQSQTPVAHTEQRHVINDHITAEFRANDGVVEFAKQAGAEMLLLHNFGAKSGEERVTPLGWVNVDGDMVIVASFSGNARHPAWYYNLVAQPDVSVEVGTEDRPVRARLTSGEERTRLFDAVKAKHPGFGDYEVAAAPREIQLFVLEPR
jgi:deazaflavin-dependent oxidoreductase (nitroreductase family)